MHTQHKQYQFLMVKTYDFKKGKFIVYYRSPQCIHCKLFNHTWETFKKALKAKMSDVKAVELTSDKPYKVVSKSPLVHGYPSVYAFNNGRITEFNLDRSVDSLMSFTQIELGHHLKGGGVVKQKKTHTRRKKRTIRKRIQCGGSNRMGAPFTFSPSSLLSQPSAPPCAQHNGAPVDVQSTIPPAQQASNPYDPMPPPSYNAGLYTGPPFDGPWGNIPVTPTSAGTTHNALRSANPPPGATQMYATGGTNRPGNSFSAKPGVNHYNGGHSSKMYNIKCTGPTGGSSKRKRVLRRRHSKRRART